MKDNLSTVKRYVDDKKVGITFNQIIDAEGEVISAKVFFRGGPEVYTASPIAAQGFTTYAGKKGEEKTVVCNFSELTPNDKYTIVFVTDSGVVAKAGLVVFDKDAFTTTTIPTPDAPTVEYQPLSARLTEITGLSPDENAVIIGTGTGWTIAQGAALRNKLGTNPVRSNDVALTLGDALVYTFTGTAATATWQLPVPQNGGFYFITNNGTQDLYIDCPTAGVIMNSDPFYIGPGESYVVWSDNANWIFR